MTKKVTIGDIAKECGVSIKTVSRVLNNSDETSDKTKEKVLKVMKEKNYQVNMLAKALKGVKTNIIVVFVDKHNNEYLSIWHNIMLKHLFTFASKEGMKIVLSSSSSEKFEEDETDAFYLIANNLASGAILLETVKNDQRIDYFKDMNIPFVVYGEPEDTKIPAVSLNNYSVGYKGGLYLIEKGYKNIQLFVGNDKFLANKNRIRGVEDAFHLKDVNLTIHTDISTIDKSYEKAKNVIESNDDVDCFFVSGDERAIGVYRAIYEKGLSIPKDIAVLGVDNIKIGNYLYPPISTVEQDFENMARACINIVVGKIKYGDELKYNDRLIQFEPNVVQRQST